MLKRKEQSRSVGQSWSGSNRAMVVVTQRDLPAGTTDVAHVTLNGACAGRARGAPGARVGRWGGRAA